MIQSKPIRNSLGDGNHSAKDPWMEGMWGGFTSLVLFLVYVPGSLVLSEIQLLDFTFVVHSQHSDTNFPDASVRQWSELS